MARPITTIALLAALTYSCMAVAQSSEERKIDMPSELSSEWQKPRPLPRGLGTALRRSKLDGVRTGVRISYSPEGDVVEATLVRSSGSEKVDAELVSWVKSMKFKPSQTGSSGVVPIDIKQAR